MNPDRLPGRYGHVDRAAFARTIAEPGDLRPPAAGMGCHVERPGPVLPCVGWLAQQLGPGNNLALRLAVMTGKVDANVETVGPQRESLA